MHKIINYNDVAMKLVYCSLAIFRLNLINLLGTAKYQNTGTEITFQEYFLKI